MKLIIIAGMPGAGKSEIADAFRDADYPVIVMGDVVREEARKRGLEANPENTRKLMLDLRAREGPDVIAIRCTRLLEESNSNLVVIEGCRSIAEIDVFDDYAKEVKIVCVHSSPSTRFTRLKERGRDDAPPEWDIFRERDLIEISVGIGGVIALTDIMIINEGTLGELRNTSKEIVSRLK